MSLFQLTASAKTCGKHPEERVVGVCSACLAQKLTSLVYTPPSTSDLPPEEYAASVSELNNLPQQNSPPGSATSPAPNRDHLQTIKEDEEDSATEVISNEQLTCQPSEPPNLVEGISDSVCPHSGDAQLILDHQENLSSSQKDSKDQSFEDKSPVATKKGSLISVSKKLSGPQEGFPTPNLQVYESEPAKCKIRSKSLSVLGADSLKLVQRASSHVEELTASFHFDNTNASNIHAKVTLRELFKLDDAEKQENKCSEALHTENADCLSDCKLTEEEIPRGAFADASAKINEETDESGTPQNHSHDSRCNCVPSSSSLPSSVCPAKIKQCILLNPLLCRKKGDEKTVNKDGRSICKPSQFHIRKHRNGNEDRNTQAMDDGGFIRATYIASESRVQSMRRCRSKMDLYGARNSFSSSEPSSPGQVFHVDSRSERKFNFSARALAIEVPSMFQAAGGPDAGETNLTAERLVSVNNEVQGGGGLPNNGELNKTALKTLSSLMSQHGNEILAREAECENGDSDNRPTSQVRGNHVTEEENKLLSIPTPLEAVAVDTQMPVISSVMDHAGKAEEIANGNTTEDELIRVCRRVIGRQQRWPSGECRDQMTTSPCDAYAMAMEEGSEGSGETAVEHGRRDQRGVVGGEGQWGTRQGKTAECGGAAEQDEKAGEGKATEYLGAWEGGGAEDREAGGERGAIAECLELGKEGAAGHIEGREHREGGAEDREVGEEGEAGEGAGTEYEDGAGHRDGRVEHLEAEEEEAWQTGGTEHVEAGEKGDVSEYRGSCKAGAGAQQHQQHLHVVWEPYCKSSGKTAGTTGRTSGRWPPVTARSVGITPDHPLLRFYLTPLRSSSRTRSRPHRSPKRSIWSLVFT
ncbi:hypothetical protein L7F22_006303 [Adiantum nelumboides]|nr:hypothetical protein [Adiantum nelumboides]